MKTTKRARGTRYLATLKGNSAQREKGRRLCNTCFCLRSERAPSKCFKCEDR